MCDASLTDKLSLTEAAQLLQVHVGTIWRWSLHGLRGRILPTFEIGGRRFVRRSDLLKFAVRPRQPKLSLDLQTRNKLAEQKLMAHGFAKPLSFPKKPAEQQRV